MKAYPEYKDSGVEWMKKIPTSWDKCKLGHLFNIFNGSTPKSDEPSYWDGDIDWVTPSDLSKISSYRINASSKKITNLGLNSCGTSIVPEGSIILSTRAPIGSLAVAGKELCTNQGCKSLVARERSNIEPKFFYYLLSISSGQLNLRGRGTTFLELPTNELSSFPVPKLTYTEQLSIVRYLDIESSRIDNLIVEKENFIKLLSEKRKALISEVVTKGLDSSVPMKDSGIDWIGEVPEHWKLGKLKHALQIKNGQDYKHIETDDFENSYPVYGSGGEFKRSTDYIYEGESVLFGRKGTIDKPIHVQGRFWTVDTMFYSVINNQSDGKYLYYLALNFPYQYYQTNTALPSMTQSSLMNHSIALPPKAEQIQIREFIEKEENAVFELIKETKNSIALLKEQKESLITAAVTGQIDVREYA